MGQWRIWNVLLFVLVGICYSTRLYSPTISYQVHSWNDLDEWPQGFLKGLQWMKIDPHYVPNITFCDLQPQVQPKDSRGCFVLTHNNPDLQSPLSVAYNTTTDVVNFIQDPTTIGFFQTRTRIYIALCFKYNGTFCNNTTEFANWVSLVSELITELQAVISRYALNLEFILDGTALPIGCLVGHWEPLVSTFQGDDPSAALLSNNASLGYDRLQVLDLPVVPYSPSYWINVLCPLHYGKFSSPNNTYPFLFWEPADQVEILLVGQSYLECGQLHPAGIRFAINIDPVQFDVYAAAITGTAWNHHVFDYGSLPNVVVLPPNTTGAVTILTMFEVASEFVYYSFGVSANGVLGNYTPQPPQLLPNGTTINLQAVQSLSIAVIDDTPLVLAVDGNTQYVFYSVSSLNGSYPVNSSMALSLVAITDGSLPYSANTQSVFSTVAMDFSPNGGVRVIQLYTTDECLVEAVVWTVTGNVPYLEIDTVSELSPPSLCIVPNDHWPYTIKYASAAMSPSLSDDITTVICGDIDSSVMVIVMSDVINNVMASFVCITANATEWSVSKTTQKPVVFDVGSDPTVAIATAPTTHYDGEAEETFILEVHTDGYCYNSAAHNKEAAPKLCSLTPQSCPNVLNYNFAVLSNFMDMILAIASGEASRGLVTSCDDSVLHGMYDQGRNPDMALFVGPSSEGLPVLAVVAVHEGLEESDVDICGCGRPTSKPGIVLDAWPLPFVSLATYNNTWNVD